MEDTSVVVSTAAGAPSAASEFRVTEGYRRYVIWLLFTCYVFNFADRSILAILVQPIKVEFGLSDSQLGMLGGLAFALFYTTLGIPIARLADRSNRVNIISASLFIWSLATGLSGLARNFVHLLLARITVGVGEAGCSPAAYSLIADYFDSKRRATAAAMYAMGISGGVFVGFFGAAWVAHAYGWRAAFFALGVPGLVLSSIVRLTLREPPRGFSDGGVAVAAQPPLGEVLKKLWAKRAFRHLSFAAAVHSFVGYGAGAWYPAFLMRSHGMSMLEVGGKLGLVTGIGGLIGSYAGGVLSDSLGNRKNDARFQLWVPAGALIINTPLAFLIYQVHSVGAVLLILLLVLAVAGMHLGPTYAAAQSMLAPRERAIGAALLLFIVNFVGLGLGPLVVGKLSDVFQARIMAGGVNAAEASSQGLVWALQAILVINVWAIVHFMLSARTIREDMIS